MDTTNQVQIDAKFANHRAVMSNYGKLFGKQVYGVTVNNVDPEYNKKLNDKSFIVSSSPIKLFGIKRITIKGMDAEVDGDNNLVIIFNGDSDLRFPISNPELRVPGVATVKDAIRAIEMKEPPIFFEDCAKLTAEITSLNNLSHAKAIKLSRELAQQAQCISESIEMDRIAMEKYLSELNADLSISITIED